METTVDCTCCGISNCDLHRCEAHPPTRGTCRFHPGCEQYAPAGGTPGQRRRAGWCACGCVEEVHQLLEVNAAVAPS